MKELIVDVVLVNWNAGSQLAEAVASIAQYHRNLVSSVIIVDNASTDASLARVEAVTDLPFHLHVIQNAENRGFGAACNQGAALANSEYLLFLNPDMRLFEHSLSASLAFMRAVENQSVGICGIQLIDEHAEVSRSCARFPTPRMFFSKMFGLERLFPGFFQNHFMEEWGHRENREVDHVIGAFFLVRRTLFEQLDGFDERFFVYLEDLDFSLRAKKSGWTSYYLADARAYHKGGGTSEQIKAGRLFYSLRSRLLYGFKHFAPWQAWALLGMTLMVEPISRSVFALLRRRIDDLSNTWTGYGMLYRDLPNILKKAYRT